ncbi:MAG TPA: hypothetical protein VM692_00600 [Gammaproteobacteria bacterium]|nr:hypothetical protein [Gammaproteobacteria bacterium]
MFEFLFKYSRATYERAELVFASGWPVWLLYASIVAAAIAIGIVIWRRKAGLGIVRATVLGALQTALVAALLVLAWRPALVTQTLRPQENSVAVLLDTSGSMLYGDKDTSRLQQAVDSLSERALPALESKFAVNLFSFSGDLVELPSLEQVPPPGPVTHVGDALLNVLRGAQSGAIAAVVLVSDGADNSADFDAAKIAEIASFGVPVHTVGVGAETMANDLELEDVQLPSIGLPGSTVSAQVSIRHSGATLAQLKVYDGDAILASEPIQLPSTSGVTTRWVDIAVGEAGVRDLRFALDALPGETNVINNSRLRPMEVPEQRRHILYIEGEPRWEYKFIRRAIDENPAVRVASLLKTTPNKFYRQGVESADELTAGFPTEELELFRYDALMIGSFEAAALTPAQQDMIREFVSRRGGSLLMLGGRRGLTDGGWGATSVAEVLPVRLPEIDGPSFMREPAKAVLAADGRTSALTRLAPTDEENEATWATLPDLADFQTLGPAKPGAQTLLNAEFHGRTEPLLVEQRYGNGHAYVLATGGTWRWQMQLPHEDQKHETFWRQLLQAAATTAPQPVTLTSDRVFYGDESTVLLRAEVRDKTYKPSTDAAVTLEVSDGMGPPTRVEMTPVAGERGLYEAAYETAHTGVFRFEAVAKTDAEELGRARFAVRREDGVIEHYRVAQNRPLLERLSAATGGSYFGVDDVSKLPEAVSFSEAGSVERQVLDLWNIPIAFLLLILLKAGEWLLRLYWGRL